MPNIHIALFASETTSTTILTLPQSRSDFDLHLITDNPDDLLHYVAIHHPPVVLLESSPELPELPPLIQYIRAQRPGSHCLILAHEVQLMNVRRAIDSGAMGYLLLPPSLETLATAIPLVGAGKLVLAPQIASLLISVP